MHKKLEPTYHTYDNEYDMIAIERMNVFRSAQNLQFKNSDVITKLTLQILLLSFLSLSSFVIKIVSNTKCL